MLKQITPSKICLSCDVCCRFLDKNAGLAPVFLPHEITLKIKPFLGKSGRVRLKSCKDIYACPFFKIKNNKCAIYPKRPLDCRLYPFAIMFDGKREEIILGIDKKCPFSANPAYQGSIKNYFHYLVDLLEKKDISALIAGNPAFIGNFQEDVAQFSSLGTLTKLIIKNPAKNGFKEISLKDKPEFDRFFGKTVAQDSCSNFVNLYIWKEKNPVWWKMGADMDADQRSAEGSLKILLETGFDYIDFDSLKKFPDYIYSSKDIAELKGNKYKHKRASCNHFSKNYRFQYLAYEPKMENDCLKLFSKWSRSRKKTFSDLYYHKLLEDSFSAHKLAMENFKELRLTGRVIKIKGRIAAYTFGFEIKKDMFCVLLEVCDLRFKGIAEFIFREFSKEMSHYEYINTMDDSGLENLRISKLSYYPIQGRF
ncbi:MAG: phosphatidylglycerol lysyltransferase domain-containing protein [Candidatus Omnitrophota bacterium]|nr:phosphatidylglycerol lysyltransferase domain-containing protein [Candidatus Omnitrophota bacterium]